MNSGSLARTLKPPYYAVVFSSLRSEEDESGYAVMAARMKVLAECQPGFLGMDSVRREDGLGITVSYWESEEAIRAWKANAEHLAAQAEGRGKWYAAYRIRVCRVEREYGFDNANASAGAVVPAGRERTEA